MALPKLPQLPPLGNPSGYAGTDQPSSLAPKPQERPGSPLDVLMSEPAAPGQQQPSVVPQMDYSFMQGTQLPSQNAQPQPSAQTAPQPPQFPPVANYLTPSELGDYSQNMLNLSSEMTPLQQMMSIAGRARKEPDLYRSDGARQQMASLLGNQLNRKSEMDWASEPYLKDYFTDMGVTLGDQDSMRGALKHFRVG